MTIETELDRLLDAHDAKVRPTAPPKSRGSIAMARRHRNAALADPRASALKKRRCGFRGGITVAQLSERSGISTALITNMEAGRPGAGSDRSWAALALALDCTRATIEPGFIGS